MTDLQDIRTIVREEVRTIVREEVRDEVGRQIGPLANEIQALRSDINEIYNMIAELQGKAITDKKFKKLSLEEKLLTLNAELLAAAKEAGIVLPRS